MMNVKKIAVIDASSRSLPYCYYYLKSISKEISVDFYCSSTIYNGEYIAEISQLENVSVKLNSITESSLVVSFMKYLLVLFSLWIKRDYDAVHFQWSIVPVFDQFAWTIFGRKLCVTFHNEVPHGFNKPRFMPYQRIANASSSICFVSHAVKSRFSRLYQVDTRMFVFPHGCMSIGVGEAVSLQSYSGGFSRNFVFWGNVKAYKGLHFLSRCKKFLGSNQLSIYGKFDSDQLYLKETLSELGVRCIDRYLEPKESVSLFKAKGSAFILPYEKATQSGVMYNCLFYCKPFVASSSGDLAEFLKGAGLEGLLFEYDDEDDLMRSVVYLEKNYNYVVDVLRSLRANYLWEYDSTMLMRFYKG